MSLSYNGTELQSITWNGDDVQVVTMDGVEVWSAHPPFLVRMRYDANEPTHVKDLVGGYTITTNTGAAIPAVADPFGGNNALNLDDIWVIYNGKGAISALKSTVCCWVKFTANSVNNILLVSTLDDRHYYSRYILFPDYKPSIQTSSSYVSAPAISNPTEWHFVEFNTDNNLYRIFVDGILVKTGTDSGLTQNNFTFWKKGTNYPMWIGQFDWSPNYGYNKFKGYIYDFCILDGVWHTENYNVPTAYI